MTFLLANWRILLYLGILLVAGAAVGVSRHQVATIRIDLAESRRAYDLLADRARACSAGVQEAEQRAREAADKGRRARQEAAGAIQVATKSAEALGRAMAAPRPASACPVAEAVQTIRADLAR